MWLIRIATVKLILAIQSCFFWLYQMLTLLINRLNRRVRSHLISLSYIKMIVKLIF